MRLHGCCVLFLVSTLLIGVAGKENKTLLMGLSGYYARRAPPFQIYKLFAGLSIALDTIQANESILENYTLNYVFEDDRCNENQAIDTIVKLVRDHDVDVIIGPGCSPACRGGGRLASVWNVPMIAYGGTDEVLSDKNTYSTFLRTVGLTSVAAQVIRQLPKVFKWERLCVYSISTAGHIQYVVSGLKNAPSTDNVTYVDPFFTFDRAIEQTKEHRRILDAMKSMCRGKIDGLIFQNNITVSVADPGGGPRGPWPPPLSQIRTISYAPLHTF